MPYSGTKFDNLIKNYIIERYDPMSKILDIGAGAGKYGKLLNFHFGNIDAIQIFQPYIKMFDLLNIYNHVYNENVLNFERFNQYQIFLLGDVVQHMEIIDAQFLLQKIRKYAKFILVQIPYQYEQGIYMGNIFEIHLQNDLTKELMDKRYPFLTHFISDNEIGLYIWESK